MHSENYSYSTYYCEHNVGSHDSDSDKNVHYKFTSIEFYTDNDSAYQRVTTS